MEKESLFTEVIDEIIDNEADGMISTTTDRAKQSLNKLISDIKDIARTLSDCNDRRDEELFALYAKMLRDKTDELQSKSKCRYNDKESSMSGTIRISSNEENRYHITIPCMIPTKRSIRLNTMNAYRTPLYKALDRYLGGTPKIFAKRVRVLITIFTKEKNLNPINKTGRGCSDDDFVYSHIINALADYFLEDDSPPYYSLCINIKDGVPERTEIDIREEGAECKTY